jgi:hypothetical protein
MSDVKPDYPTACVCPGCGEKKRVMPAIETLGYTTREVRVIETHAIVVSQDDMSGNGDTVTITYPCPASGANVSPWRRAAK